MQGLLGTFVVMNPFIVQKYKKNEISTSFSKFYMNWNNQLLLLFCLLVLFKTNHQILLSVVIKQTPWMINTKKLTPHVRIQLYVGSQFWLTNKLPLRISHCQNPKIQLCKHFGTDGTLNSLHEFQKAYSIPGTLNPLMNHELQNEKWNFIPTPIPHRQPYQCLYIILLWIEWFLLMIHPVALISSAAATQPRPPFYTTTWPPRKK